MKINNDIINRLDNIDWLANCGKPIALEKINQSIIQVDNWKSAKKWYTSPSWERTTLEAGNILTSFLHKKYPNKYLEWNTTVRAAKVYMEASLSDKLQKCKERYGLDPTFVDCVNWDILHAIMVYAYSDCKNIPNFFLDLLLIYESGNFPCGWDGRYPKEGRLVIY